MTNSQSKAGIANRHMHAEKEMNTTVIFCILSLCIPIFTLQQQQESTQKKYEFLKFHFNIIGGNCCFSHHFNILRNGFVPPTMVTAF